MKSTSWQCTVAAAALCCSSVGCAEGSTAPESLYDANPSASSSRSEPTERSSSQMASERTPAEVTPVGPELLGLHAVGNLIQNAAGETVQLRGVNRSGTEYQCVQNRGIFEGPSSIESVQAIAAWNANAVRVPLNEACWLGINNVSPAFSGETYRQAILAYVATLHDFHIAPILDLHWTAPGEVAADRLQPLPNVDHSIEFWRSVAE